MKGRLNRYLKIRYFIFTHLMHHELVDAYDESLNIVGVIEREDAHRKGILHKTVHCWFIDRDFVYFQIRGKRVGFPGLLDVSVGGHVSSSESTETALLRELNEEVGIRRPLEDLKYIGNNRFDFEEGELRVSEFSDVYFTSALEGLDAFIPNEFELAGIAAVPFIPGLDVLLGKTSELEVRVMTVDNDTRKHAHHVITSRSFVPSITGYFARVLEIGRLYGSGRESVRI